MDSVPTLHLLLSFLIFSSFNSSLLIKASDSISRGQFLSGNNTITSKGAKFELGFFKPGSSKNYYIGIWYKNIPVQTIIWVANRETPVTNPSTSKLKFSKTGNLALYNNSSSTPVWSSNSSSSTPESISAVLLDTGNLVLINGSDSDSYLWQSFDHPTDTWMPGGWLGVNKITREYQSLTSWKNPDDPAPGLFAQSMDPDGSNQYVILWNGSEIYWTSGLWNGQFFSNVPGTKEHTVFNFSFIDNSKRKFATYTILANSVITRCVMDSTGQVLQWYWLKEQWQPVFTQPLHHCDVYSLCGPFGVCDEKSSSICRCSDGFHPANDRDWELNDWTLGCSRKSRLQCGDKDGFLEMANVKLPADRENLMVHSSKECESKCMNNCSCNAYAYDSGGCSIWKGDLRNLQQLHDGDIGGSTLFIRLLATDIPTSGNSHHNAIPLILGVVFGVIAIICVVFALAFVYRRRKRAQALKQVEGSLIQFRFSELQRMTKNFSEKLGSGGFGTVFKGTMPDSTAIAVKKLEGLRQGEKQFRTEVSTLGAVQHVNLVRLRGFCYKGSDRLLVYDYMKEGSLDSQLFRDNPTFLNWVTRILDKSRSHCITFRPNQTEVSVSWPQVP
ncbi:uncharacterized protein A4U43_C03F8860 [Asparagus officinalis]|uniref:non-specific serine/threonine protein kinase n=1 Tax=Asparagus officinalis TaxID=4686 RepID=A0A5P1F983_ASPOF|nr:uncharacterized protein A4U43_C03F8860 [Asparagus officinalis]